VWDFSLSAKSLLTIGCGHMAMALTHTQLVYTAKTAKANFIDISQGLAFMNSQNCTQFKKDKPLLYSGTIRMSSSSESVSAARNSWPVRNACVKAAAAWRRTLRSAGIRRSSKLNTYAKEMRFAFRQEHSLCWGGIDGVPNAALVPDNVAAYYSTGVYDSSGDEIHVYSYADLTVITPGPTSRFKHAFTQTTAAVPQSGSTDVTDKRMNLLGAVDSNYLNVVAEYNDSRINTADVEDDDFNASPSNDNDFIMMLAPGEEVADDVLDNVDDEGKWRPYSTVGAESLTAVISPAANVAGQDTYFEAPLGLLQWDPKEVGSQLIIDITSVSEM